MAILFELDQIEITYKADFSPPILDLVSTEKQITFVKGLVEKFQLRYGDLIVNPQILSSSFIFFRKLTQIGVFNISIGVDSFTTYYFNPSDAVSAWEPSLNVLKSMEEIVKIPFEKQTLTFNANCHSEQTRGIDYINRYNNFNSENEILNSKGISFNFSGPIKDSNIFLAINESPLIPNGLFVTAQAEFGKQVTEFEMLFSHTVEYLRKKILPILNFDILFQERKEPQ